MLVFLTASPFPILFPVGLYTLNGIHKTDFLVSSNKLIDNFFKRSLSIPAVNVLQATFLIAIFAMLQFLQT